jgi:hypothetical protein
MSFVSQAKIDVRLTRKPGPLYSYSQSGNNPYNCSAITSRWHSLCLCPCFPHSPRSLGWSWIPGIPHPHRISTSLVPAGLELPFPRTRTSLEVVLLDWTQSANIRDKPAKAGENWNWCYLTQSVPSHIVLSEQFSWVSGSFIDLHFSTTENECITFLPDLLDLITLTSQVFAWGQPWAMILLPLPPE